MADVRRLPAPVTPVWDWQMRAACRQVDSTVFFHPASERGPAAAARDHDAKQVCATCPVVQACLRHALTVREPYGVWGGLTTGERDAILRPGRRLSGSRRQQPDGPTHATPEPRTDRSHH